MQEVSFEGIANSRKLNPCWPGNDNAVTTEPKYERLETAKDGDTRAARCTSDYQGIRGDTH